jgi:citrate synthase
MGTETKPEYSPGLAGVIAGETAICWVDPAAGLMYRGYDIHQMAEKATFEEVAYLLLNGELPNAKQLKEFRQQIAGQRELPGAVTEMLRLLPKNTHPMDMLRTGVSMLSAFDKDLSHHSHDANIRKSIRLIARASTLITDGWRISQGEQPFPEKPELTQAANFFYKFNGKVPERWQTRMLDTIFNLYADHEFNASTFAARVTASTLAGIYAAVTSAVATLKGPLHGGANEESMKMLEEIGTPDRAEAWLMKKLGSKGKIMGFGHRVYKKGDSRVPAMREIARDLGKRTGKENLREARTSDGPGETTLCQCRSLRRARVLAVGISSRVEYASFRCVPRSRLVRARYGATRSQSSDPAALILRRPAAAAVSRAARVTGNK